MNMKKIFKITILLALFILVPTLICIIVLYSNEKALLIQFQRWVDQPGNLSAFVISIGVYFPLVNGIWKLIVNILTAHTIRKNLKRDKSIKTKIYDDEKNNYIYYDEKNNIIDLQFKAVEDVKPDKLIEMMIMELKTRIKDFTKNTKEK